MIGSIAALLLLQDTHAHHMPPPEKKAEEAHEADPHAGHDMSAMETPQQDADAHAGHDMGMMQDHSMHAMGMGADKLAGIPMGPPPREAGEGPARAAEALYGVEAMQAARAQLIHETGQQKFFGLLGERVEARLGGDSVGFLWDLAASYGGDLDRIWIESEGEGDVEEGAEDADIEANWGHAIAPFWDLTVGARQDIVGSRRTYATVGVQGLAPYLFHVDAGAYLSSEGEVTASIEAELDQLVTNRLILQPRGEVLLSAQDIPELGIGAGIAKVEAGVRLRYEFSREFAPYVGVAQEWRLSDGEAGGDDGATRFVAGVRFWF